MLPPRASWIAAFTAVLGLEAVCVGAELNWPGWRGPQQNGHTTDTNLPVKWSAKDVAWKTQLPGSGQSSPVIWGERVFLTSALDQGKERVVLCLDRKTGQIVCSRRHGRVNPSQFTT